MYLVSVVVRLIWSLTIGLPFFIVGLILFLILDIFSPQSEAGHTALANMYSWGSCYWFKGLRMETENYTLQVKKKREREQSGK